MSAHTRLQIHLEFSKDVNEFVKLINSDGTTDKYVLTNFDESYVVDARSYLGVLCASGDFEGNIFLINLTNDGVYPSGVYQFVY